MPEIIEYVREKRRGKVEKVGVLLGWSVNGNDIKIGWSKVMFRQKGKDMDTFNRERGLEIARARKEGFSKKTQVPHVIRKHLPKFQERCLRYFKGAKLYHYPLSEETTSLHFSPEFLEGLKNK